MKTRVNTTRALFALKHGKTVRLHSVYRTTDFRLSGTDRVEAKVWDWEDAGTTEDFKRCHKGEIGFEVLNP